MKVLAAAILLVIVAGCSGNLTGLSIKDYWDHGIDVQDRWMSNAQGSVVNNGKGTASNVYVDCVATRKGSIVGAQRVYLGSLAPTEEKDFQTTVDYTGAGAVSGTCSVVCSTCGK